MRKDEWVKFQRNDEAVHGGFGPTLQLLSTPVYWTV